MSASDGRILDLRSFGLNPAGDLPDRSGYGFDHAPNAFVADTEFVDGQYGQALSLVPNKYLSYALQVGDVLDFRFGFSYEVWLRRTGNFGADAVAMGKGLGWLGSEVSAYLRFPAANTVSLRVGDGTGFGEVASLSTITDTNLHYIVATYDLNTIRISIDGVEDNSGVIVYPSLLSVVGFNFEIGRMPNVHGNYIRTEYEALRVYNRPLGAAEIMRNKILGPNRT